MWKIAGRSPSNRTRLAQSRVRSSRAQGNQWMEKFSAWPPFAVLPCEIIRSCGKLAEWECEEGNRFTWGSSVSDMKLISRVDSALGVFLAWRSASTEKKSRGSSVCLLVHCIPRRFSRAHTIDSGIPECKFAEFYRGAQLTVSPLFTFFSHSQDNAKAKLESQTISEMFFLQQRAVTKRTDRREWTWENYHNSGLELCYEVTRGERENCVSRGNYHSLSEHFKSSSPRFLSHSTLPCSELIKTETKTRHGDWNLCLISNIGFTACLVALSSRRSVQRHQRAARPSGVHLTLPSPFVNGTFHSIKVHQSHLRAISKQIWPYL